MLLVVMARIEGRQAPVDKLLEPSLTLSWPRPPLHLLRLLLIRNRSDDIWRCKGAMDKHSNPFEC